jgi:hypothetical protein
VGNNETGWVYKCNREARVKPDVWGVWQDFFEEPGDGTWGGTDTIRNKQSLHFLKSSMARGDWVIAYQTDERAIVGLVRFVGLTDPDDGDQQIRLSHPLAFQTPVPILDLCKTEPSLRSLSPFKQGWPASIYSLADRKEEDLLLGVCARLNPDQSLQIAKYASRRRLVPMVRGRATRSKIESITQEEYEEGFRKEIVADRRERNRKLVADAKEYWRSPDGRLRCAVCTFCFSDKYGEHGDGFIEVHHLTPISEARSTGRRTTVKQVRLVCANCHRMLHRGERTLLLKELKAMLRSVA